MNHYDTNYSRKRKDKQHFQENKSQAFRCGHCHAMIVINEYSGTANRNHCNFCLWSKHVDNKKGDRNSDCCAGMQPIGLTLKNEGSSKVGELMLIHCCSNCQKISINRIAGDDDVYEILRIFENSQNLEKNIRNTIITENIDLLQLEDKEEIERQLFGS